MPRYPSVLRFATASQESPFDLPDRSLAMHLFPGSGSDKEQCSGESEIIFPGRRLKGGCAFPGAGNELSNRFAIEEQPRRQNQLERLIVPLGRKSDMRQARIVWNPAARRFDVGPPEKADLDRRGVAIFNRK